MLNNLSSYFLNYFEREKCKNGKEKFPPTKSSSDAAKIKLVEESSDDELVMVAKPSWCILF